LLVELDLLVAALGHLTAMLLFFFTLLDQEINIIPCDLIVILSLQGGFEEYG
jgi:hypothetical protein